MDEVCSGCLCSGRKLRFLGDTNFYQLYSQILNEICVYEISQICIRICWECCALLKKFERFKEQVKNSYSELLWSTSPSSHTPHLTTTIAYNLSYPESNCDDQTKQAIDFIKEEDILDNNIKTEAEDNDDSVLMFVNDLPVHKDEAKKKPEKPIKEKKTKIKIRKNKTNKVPALKVSNEKMVDKKLVENCELQEIPLNENKEIIEAKLNEIDGKLTVDNSDAVSDADMPGDSCQDDDDDNRPLKEMRNDKLDSPSKENVVNGVKVVKPKPVLPSKPVVELLPEKPQCAECGKTFSSRKTYRYHLNVLHKGNNQYPCPRCGKIYQWKSNLGRHMRTHKAVDDGELYCEQCDKSFASVATYRQHLRISRRHVSENEFSFTCNECGKKFVNKTRLRDHVDWEHLKKIKFRCQLCNKPFKCHTSLYVHLQNVHRNKEKKDNLCHVCGKSYQNAAKLKYHIIALHTGETPYQCSQCTAAFGWYSSLYRHIREVHYKVKSQPKKTKKAKKMEMEPPPYMEVNYHPQ